MASRQSSTKKKKVNKLSKKSRLLTPLTMDSLLMQIQAEITRLSQHLKLLKKTIATSNAKLKKAKANKKITKDKRVKLQKTFPAKKNKTQIKQLFTAKKRYQSALELLENIQKDLHKAKDKRKQESQALAHMKALKKTIKQFQTDWRLRKKPVKQVKDRKKQTIPMPQTSDEKAIEIILPAFELGVEQEMAI